MAFEATKREWCELYTFFRLLTEGKVTLGTAKAKKGVASGRGCTVIPCAPKRSQSSAARTTSGRLPPRELRTTAILLMFTLSFVIKNSIYPKTTGNPSNFTRKSARLPAPFAIFARSGCTVIIFGYKFSQLPGFHYLCRKQDAPRKTGNKFPFSPGFHYLCRWIEGNWAIFACKLARLLSPFTIFAEVKLIIFPDTTDENHTFFPAGRRPHGRRPASDVRRDRPFRVRLRGQ